MGSLRNELQLPAQFASTGSIEEEDDEDEDIMLMGTTPQVILTSSGNFWQCYNVPCSSVASVTRPFKIYKDLILRASHSCNSKQEMQPRPVNPVPRFETTPVPAFRQHTWTSGQMISHD